jgi:hypothetical protein
MDQIGLKILLDELKCIKLPKDSRVFVNAAALQFSSGNLSTDIVLRIQAVARRYRDRLEELRLAREKAKRSLWKQNNGVTEGELAQIVNAKRAKDAAAKSDLGI